MNCPACAQFGQNPLTGAVRKGCQACQTREIANGQPFFESRKLRNRTRPYMAQLESLFGKDGIEKGHAEVRRVAGLICGEVV